MNLLKSVNFFLPPALLDFPVCARDPQTISAPLGQTQARQIRTPSLGSGRLLGRVRPGLLLSGSNDHHTGCAEDEPVSTCAREMSERADLLSSTVRASFGELLMGGYRSWWGGEVWVTHRLLLRGFIARLEEDRAL